MMRIKYCLNMVRRFNMAIESSLAQLITPTPIPHKSLKPTPFNGKEYFIIVELSAKEWIPYAIGYLGEARSWWRGTKRIIQNILWIDFKSIFLRQFTPWILFVTDLINTAQMDAGQWMYLFINGLERELSNHSVRQNRAGQMKSRPIGPLGATHSIWLPKIEPMEIDAIFTTLNAILRNNNRFRNNNNNNNNHNKGNSNNNNNRSFNAYTIFFNNNKNNNTRPFNIYTTSPITKTTTTTTISTCNKARTWIREGRHFTSTNPPRLDNFEQEYCMRLGLCLCCRQLGHLACSCPVFHLNVLETDTSKTHAPIPDLDPPQQSGKA
ncbi:MAG: hypothetical protein J3R72DRAFT_466325 [Linnemannia gamsii]|nr:MAG: hypothetical protein J3R72DRAFT_466325 [Linnemannia gamsii]